MANPIGFCLGRAKARPKHFERMSRGLTLWFDSGHNNQPKNPYTLVLRSAMGRSAWLDWMVSTSHSREKV
jgi:hypothetical protein